MSLFLQALSRGVLIFDGAMGTATHAFDLDVDRDFLGKENCPEILVRSRPELIQSVHESFYAVGSDCVETDTFGGMPHVLAEFDLAHEAFALNKAAAELARAAADKFTTKDKPRFVVGSMGPGTKLITLGNIDWDAMFASYRDQARGLLAGGVDAFIIETCQDLLQVKCVVNAIIAALAEHNKTALDVPIMASVTIETTGTMLLGTEIAAAAAALAQYPICSLGLNCATGPTEMAEHVRWLGQHWGAMGSDVMREARVSRQGPAHRPISIMPNAGLPILVEGKTEFPLAPDDFARAMLDFVHRDGVRIVGGCCGTTAAHIGALVKGLESTPVRPSTSRVVSAPSTQPPTTAEVAAPQPAAPDPGVTSLYAVQDYRQDNSILIVGERMNASGSRAFKKLLEAEDWDGMVSLAREQVRHDGAHVLDINVDYAGRDNARDMAEVVRRVVRQVNIPLMLDSTQTATIEAGLKHSGGKCIINSANFEDGEHKFDQVCQLAKTYGAALVIGSIDEDKEASMARTAERKLAIAQRAYRRAVDVHGIHPADLLFDPLVLPISTGMESDRRSALETIEGVRAIAREMPECQTTVGLSNCSFGLKPAARVVLNSVFLHELQQAGLTSAILHFSKILPENRIPQEQWAAALDLIYDRRNKDGVQGFDPLQAFIELFKDADAPGAAKKEARVLSLEEKLRAHIIDGEKEALSDTINLALAKYKPLDIINDHLLDGMKTVGELFGSGRMQLPFVLQSAEVMKMAVSLLEPHMERAAGSTKGSIVLATVKGDVHDIGKNLVDIILTNNGYTVHNIGIKQPIADIIRAWKETKAHAIGLSGLLVKSVNVMEENLKELNDQGLSPHVILGGAALTRHYCESHLRSTYKGKLFYGKDAFDGLRTMDLIMGGKTDELDSEIESRQSKRTNAEETIVRSRIERLAAANASDAGTSASATHVAPARSDVAINVPIPRAPFLGTRVVDSIDLDDVYPFINPVALFRGQWQLKKGAMSDAEYDALVEDKIMPMFEGLKAQAKRDAILQPKVVYGYFPCNAQGDDLVIWDWENSGARVGEPVPASARERARFTFPRQGDKRRLCIADFFRPTESNQVDVIAMHCVTMGSRASEAAKALFEANRYTDYLYLHGLGVETAEALAELWHKRIRQEMGIASEDAPKIRDLFTQKYRGSRYSFGYPACPRMSDQDTLFALLDPSRIGCVLTENWQIDPEQSTSAIIVHHPEAKYFNV
jgi:5-methyltetrahydrofolate--homocysteine methyltransferase